MRGDVNMKKVFNVIYMVFLLVLFVTVMVMDFKEFSLYNTMVLVALIPAIIITIKDIRE